jgi:hypothetical protein
MPLPTINVPERNRAIKRLLQTAFPLIAISVRAGSGSAYHWVYIKFSRRPDPMPVTSDINGTRFTDHIAGLIRSADIHLSEFPRDDAGRDHGMLPCLVVDLPRVPS